MSVPTCHPRFKNLGDEAIGPVVLAKPDPESADSLISINEPDDLANEQTWPTEEEMNDLGQETGGASLPDARAGTTPKRIKKIPKGMSEYQAAWIVDSEEEDDWSDHGSRGADAESMNTESHGEMEGTEEVEMVADEMVELESKKSIVAFQDLDVEEETRQ